MLSRRRGALLALEAVVDSMESHVNPVGYNANVPIGALDTVARGAFGVTTVRHEAQVDQNEVSGDGDGVFERMVGERDDGVSMKLGEGVGDVGERFGYVGEGSSVVGNGSRGAGEGVRGAGEGAGEGAGVACSSSKRLG